MSFANPQTMQQKVHNYVVQGPHIFKCYCVYNTSHVNPILSSSQSIFTSTFFLYLLHGEPQPLKNVHEAVQLISRCKEQHPVTTALMHLSASKLLYNQKFHVGLWEEDRRCTTLNKTIFCFSPFCHVQVLPFVTFSKNAGFVVTKSYNKAS